MSLIGLDIGTTGCKSVVFDAQGTILGQGAREYAILTPNPQWAEQDAEAVWRLALEAIQTALLSVPAHDPPRALALSVQGEAVIPVDRESRALRHAILGMDTRTGGENAWLASHFGPEALFHVTGMPLHTINTLPKLLWLQRHEPDLWKTAHQFLLYEDFFLRRLGGVAWISHCLASRTQLYDLQQGDWADSLLDECGIERERLAPLAPLAGGPVGMLLPEVAKQLGIRHEVILASGGHDQACAALGSGVIREGQALVSTGTAEVVEVALRTPALNQHLRESNISVYRHVTGGLYLAMTLNHCGGLLLRWFRDAFCEPQVLQAAASHDDPYNLILNHAPPAPTGLLVLPHFAGSGTPWLDTSSKGAILGLTLSTNRPTLAKGILEGLTFELRVNLDLLRKAGVSISELRTVGGGAKSPLWLRLKADIGQVPLCVPQVTEAACLGAALLAGAAAGVYPDLETAVTQTVHIRDRIAPDPATAAAYQGLYETYQRLYPALKALHVGN
ncbi:MAG: L-fuculokinase [bacterium]